MLRGQGKPTGSGLVFCVDLPLPNRCMPNAPGHRQPSPLRSAPNRRAAGVGVAVG